jgi:hypothetical protein
MSRGGQIGHQNFHKLCILHEKLFFKMYAYATSYSWGWGWTVQLMLSRALNGAQFWSERWLRHSQK